MPSKDLIADPVFQLNLLIWMAIEQPPDHFRVRPLFYQGGFELLGIELPFVFPVEASRRIQAAASKAKLAISIQPEPDLMLRHTSGQEALYLEAKLSSHSASSSSAKQTRGHLLATGPVFGEVYGGLERCLLIYVVPEPDQAQMKECLDVLTKSLKELELEPGNGAADGLSVTSTTAYYHPDSATAEVLGINATKIAIIEGLEEETDPSPLLLVYSDEDCYENSRKDFYRTALQNQVLARLISDLHRAPVKTDFRVSARDLLVRTTAQVFNHVGKKRQTSMETLIVENIFRVIVREWTKKTPRIVKVDSREIVFHFWDESHKERLLDWLENAKKTNFPSGKPALSAHGELFSTEALDNTKKSSSA